MDGDTKHAVVHLQKLVSAEPMRVFDAWGTADGWNSWFTTGAVVDFHVGGSYENADHDTGTFTRIEPISEDGVGVIAFTWNNAEHCPNTLVTVTISREGSDTCVTLEHSGLGGTGGVQDMMKGWSWALESLKSWLETGKSVSYEAWCAANNLQP